MNHATNTQPKPICEDGFTEIWVRPPFNPERVRLHLRFLSSESLDTFAHQVETFGKLLISPPIHTTSERTVELVLESSQASTTTSLPLNIDHHITNSTAIYMDVKDPWVRQALRGFKERAFHNPSPKPEPDSIDLMGMVREAQNKQANPKPVRRQTRPTPTSQGFDLMGMVREAQNKQPNTTKTNTTTHPEPTQGFDLMEIVREAQAKNDPSKVGPVSRPTTRNARRTGPVSRPAPRQTGPVSRGFRSTRPTSPVSRPGRPTNPVSRPAARQTGPISGIRPRFGVAENTEPSPKTKTNPFSLKKKG